MTAKGRPDVDPGRRQFVGWGVAGLAGVTIAPGVLLFDLAHGRAPDLPASGKVRWGMLIDTTQCREGCSDCVTACNKENGLPGGTSATAVQWIRKVEIKEVSTGRKMSLSGSFRSPKRMALFVQDSAQAGCWPLSMRCTHRVQLSTVPLPRGTSGFWSVTGSWTNERALYGQAIMQ